MHSHVYAHSHILCIRIHTHDTHILIHYKYGSFYYQVLKDANKLNVKMS